MAIVYFFFQAPVTYFVVIFSDHILSMTTQKITYHAVEFDTVLDNKLGSNKCTKLELVKKFYLIFTNANSTLIWILKGFLYIC